MGKKKKQKVANAADETPWCYYCDRTFDHEEVLIQHQKQKHFKCPTCAKKLNTISGLVIHCQTVHKESLDAVPQAKEGRTNPSTEVFGMAGIPQDVIAERTARRAAMGFQPPLPEESPLPHPPAHAHHAHTLPRSYHMPAPPMGMMYPSPVPYPSGYAAPPAPLVHPLPQGMPMPMPPRLPYGFPPPLSGGGGNFAEQHTLQTPASAPLPPVDQQSTSADLGDMARTDVLPGMNPAAPMEPGLLYRDESRSMEEWRASLQKYRSAISC